MDVVPQAAKTVPRQVNPLMVCKTFLGLFVLILFSR